MVMSDAPQNLLGLIRNRSDLYLVLLSWVAVGAVVPSVVAAAWSILSFLFLLRKGDTTTIILAFLAMLIFSDSRSPMFAFAGSAKVAVLILLFLNVVRNLSEFRKQNVKIFLYFLPFLTFAVLSTFWAADTSNAFQKSVSYTLLYFTVPLYFAKALADNRRIGLDFFAFLTVILGSGVVLYLLNSGVVMMLGRYRGILGNPNGLGLFMVLSFVLAYSFWHRSRSEMNYRPVYMVLIPVFVLSLILTGSRTALFAILIFFVFNRLKYFTNFATLLGFVALVLGYDYLLQQLPTIIMALGLEDYLRLETIASGSGRQVAWDFALKQIENVYFTGGGFTYTEYIFKLNKAELSMLGHQGNAHNTYLTLWLDTGIIGLTLFIAGLLRTLFRAAANTSIALPIAYAVMFTTYYESWLSASLNPFTSLFLISLTLLSQPVQETEAAENEEVVSDSEEHPEKPVMPKFKNSWRPL